MIPLLTLGIVVVGMAVASLAVAIRCAFVALTRDADRVVPLTLAGAFLLASCAWMLLAATLALIPASVVVPA